MKVLLAQEQAFLADGRHWVHKADFLVATRGDAFVQLTLPSAARLLALALDDQAVTPRPAGPETYGIPLGGPPGPAHLEGLLAISGGGGTLRSS